MNPFLRSILLAGVACMSLDAPAIYAAAVPDATEAPNMHLAIRSANADDVLHLTVGHSVILSSATPVRKIYVGDPSVLQTYTSGQTELVLTAKTAGVTSMVLWDQSGERKLYSIFADSDSDEVRRSLADAFPGVDIHAETKQGRIVLSGVVPTEAMSDAAAKLAGQYSHDVVNALRVVAPRGKQVQLKLRIVEVDRTRLDEMGINFFAGGRTSVGVTTGQFPSSISGGGTSPAVSNPLDIFLYNAKLNAGLTIDDLEQRHVLQVLAEPTLTTESGLAARFLSGGEFPFPVVQSGTGNATAITIQFRPYGVKVDFTPTVNPDGSIHLKLSPEVSTLDYTNAVTVSGFTIPALSTRRAETEVEIRDGQSFAVSGLLDHRTTEIMSKMPGVGDLPILGPLFRSKNFNHSVVELVIVVTATLVDPLAPNAATEPPQPQFVVPNMDTHEFDRSVPGHVTTNDTYNAPAASSSAAGEARP